MSFNDVTQSGRWVRRGGRIAVLPGGGAGFGAEREAGFELETGSGTRPAADKLRPHFHVRKALPAGNLSPASGAPRQMTPADMNPGFIDPKTDRVRMNTAPGGLQTALVNLLKGSRFKPFSRMIKIALVDLTGTTRFYDPDFAGWGAEDVVYGASMPKICALYAARQLRFELEVCAKVGNHTTKAALLAAMKGLWEGAGIPAKVQPSLDELFTFTPSGSSPVRVAASATLEKLIDCTFAQNSNWAASLLIDRVGLPYIASLMVQSGLFHPTRGGLWLKGLYVPKKKEQRDCFDPDAPLTKPHPVDLVPAKHRKSVPVHGVSALSAATFFTLMAQGRLADDATSLRIDRDLQPACTVFGDALTCLRYKPASKCGYYKEIVDGKVKSRVDHDAILIERNVGAGCGGRLIRYVAVLLTVNAFRGDPARDALFAALLDELDKLIQKNNP